MNDDLVVARRIRKAAEILRSDDHPFHDFLARELDAWTELDNAAGAPDMEGEAVVPGVSPSTLARLPDWGTRRHTGRLIQGRLP
jgi:hypothetical protein